MEWGTRYKENQTGNICKHFPCHAGQMECLNNSAKYILALGGKNGGKTSVAMLWLLNEIAKFEGKGQFLIVGPTYDVVTSATLQAWEITVKGTAYEGKRENKQGFVGATNNPHYKLATGGIIYFRSASADFEGIKPKAIVVDEAGNISETQYTTILGRATQGARIFLSTTPYLAHDWLVRLIMHPADRGDADYFYRSFPSILNPTTDPKTIEHYRRTLAPWQFAMDYEGKFSQLPFLVYDFKHTGADGLERSSFVGAGDLPPPDRWSGFYGAVDFGGTDPHCFLVGLLDVTDTLWIIAEHYKPGDILGLFDSMKRWADTFKAKQAKWQIKHSVKTWWCDHQKSAILSLRKLGFNAKPALKGPESIPLGIGLVQSKIRTGQLKVVLDECPNLKAESLLYRYPMVDGVVASNRPFDRDNHSMDSLRYLCLGIWGKDVGKQLRQAS